MNSFCGAKVVCEDGEYPALKRGRTYTVATVRRVKGLGRDPFVFIAYPSKSNGWFPHRFRLAYEMG